MKDGVRFRLINGKVYIHAEDLIETIEKVKNDTDPEFFTVGVDVVRDYIKTFLTHQA